MFDYPQRLSLARTPTPLQPLDRISSDLGGPRIWIKRDDLTGSTLSGNKVRKLEFVVAQALSEGCDTLITCGGTQSNHCRATAVIAAQLGLEVCLILREDAAPRPDGNLLLDYLVGAKVHTVSKNEYQRDLEGLFQRWDDHYAAQGRKAFRIPTGASDEIGLWGYVACGEELRTDFQTHGIKPAHIVVATGSGGTQAGLSAGAALFDLPATVLGMAVCDSERYFNSKVARDLQDWKQRYAVNLDLDRVVVATNAEFIGRGYGLADREVYDSIQYVAGREGIVLDPVYTGKAFHGLLSLIRAGRFSGHSDLVFVHTGGIFGLFPHRQRFDLAP
ncbi:D-cysteine desulfhydrase family protein [Gilvimarinus sp. F26214L]|uniref:D-cysteine desulfhydrase family protein n=1 Tax=Gilvimarinus sp. DZF01 TaxID=3461371 RepID=UPI004045327C